MENIKNKIDSRCGLHCTGCEWKETCGCGGCIETLGHPFHGECRIAICCQNKGITHCGECNIMPCQKLYEYSYLDPEHGDKPQGTRVQTCRNWAAQDGKQVWENVLLTSAAFEDETGKRNNNIISKFHEMLPKPIDKAKVLFIPTAATTDQTRLLADSCKSELISIGIKPENILTYYIDGNLSAYQSMEYDVIYFTGGDTRHLLNEINKFDFDKIIKNMVYNNKLYVGVSAGSLIATPNIGDPYDITTSGLCLVNAYLSVHQAEFSSLTDDMKLPHISLTDNNALAVSCKGFEVISN